MITNIKVKNVYIFSDEVELSLNADMRFKKFKFNVHEVNNFNVLKSIGIYGPNNVGKTCLLKVIKGVKGIILDKDNIIKSNLFTDSPIAELRVTFLYEENVYCYDLKYDCYEEEFIYEKFEQIFKDKYGNTSNELIFLRDTVKSEYIFKSKEVEAMMPLMSKSNILIHLIESSKSKNVDEIKKILTGFASKIEVVNMNNIPMRKTIEIMKNRNNMQDKIVEFIKNADLDLEDFKFVDEPEINVDIKSDIEADEQVLNITDRIMDQLRLMSVYKGKKVPSMLFDSTGTKKMIALSSYIIDTLQSGKVLVIDELDNSLHFKLSRAIVSMFNNELNQRGQLIFSIHDVNLMDCKKLFRKEQIWFVHKDENGNYVYPLSVFTAEGGIRDTSDIIKKYKKGVLGALPEPSFINTLLGVVDDN